MKILFSTGSLHHLSYEEIFSLAAEAQFEGIELNIQRPKDLYNIDIPKLQNLSKKFNLPIITVHAPSYERYLLQFFARPSFITFKVLFHSLKLAEELGSQLVVTHPWPALFFREKRREKMKTVLNRLNRPPGIKLGIEIMPSLGRSFFSVAPHSIKTAEEFKEFCSSHHYLMVLDVTHCRSLSLNPTEVFLSCKDFIINIHLSDFKDGKQHLPLGSGDTDFADFFENLKKHSYSGFITLELQPSRFKELKVIKECYDFIKNLSS